MYRSRGCRLIGPIGMPGSRLAGLDGRMGPVTAETPNPDAGTGIDTTVPHSARVWNYWLGGKDNYAVDRATGDAVIAVYPQIKVNARESRKFLQRVVTFLAGEAGI